MGGVIEMSRGADFALRLFHSLFYLRHNGRRQEHLASLGLDLRDKRVLEVGAGIGDHTTFFVDRNCSVFALEARADNCEAFQVNFQMGQYKKPTSVQLLQGDLMSSYQKIPGTFDIVYCYGFLYHVADPAAALKVMADRCTDLLLLELCVSTGDEESINNVGEVAASPAQAFDGTGCRPTRPWVLNTLRTMFDHVYVPVTQPAHEEFPLDWSAARPEGMLSRAVFVASRKPLDLPLLTEELPMIQRAA